MRFPTIDQCVQSCHIGCSRCGSRPICAPRTIQDNQDSVVAGEGWLLQLALLRIEISERIPAKVCRVITAIFFIC